MASQDSILGLLLVIVISLGSLRFLAAIGASGTPMSSEGLQAAPRSSLGLQGCPEDLGWPSGLLNEIETEREVEK